MENSLENAKFSYDDLEEKASQDDAKKDFIVSLILP